MVLLNTSDLHSLPGRACQLRRQHFARRVHFGSNPTSQRQAGALQSSVACANYFSAGDAVLEVVFEVDVNGILKVTATEKTSGRSANITISNSVGKLSASEIESMINGKQCS